MTNMFHQNPLVSVVVPVYNRADLIAGALESVWEQTYRPIELVVVDDGSTDDTRERALQWANRYDGEPGFKFWCLQQENRGANAARNLGIQCSKGELVAFIDSDDRWLSMKLERQVPLFDDPEVGAVYCGTRLANLVDGSKNPIAHRSYPQGWLLKTLLVHDVTAGTPCYVIKRECFDQVGFFDVSLSARQDWDMWIRVSARYKIACVPEALVQAGAHTGPRLSMDYQKSIEAHWRIFEKYAPLRRKYSPDVRRSAEAALFRRLGRIYFHHAGCKRKALQMYLRAIIAWPFCFDSYAALAGLWIPDNLRQNMNIMWNRVFGKTSLAIRSF